MRVRHVGIPEGRRIGRAGYDWPAALGPSTENLLLEAKVEIKPYDDWHLPHIVRLSLRAWAPVFDSLQRVMSPAVYKELTPDWEASQTKAVEEVCEADDMHVWVAVEKEAVAGFVAVKLDHSSSVGEIYMIAVDPGFQRRGIGAALTEFAAEWMKQAGMSVAMVETGGDPGHAPARHTYESAGFELLPIARYFRKL